MALTITHAFVSGVADDPAAAAAGEVLPSQWDAAHVIGTGGVDQAIFFDQAGAFGQDANLEWDYTNHILNLGPNARLNSNGTTWRFDVGGTNKLDYNVSFASAWTLQNFAGTLGTGLTGSGFYSILSGDLHPEVGIEIDTATRPYVFFGVGSAPIDLALFRATTATLGIQCSSPTVAAGLQVYNISDTFAVAGTNYERAVFDWTTTANVLTIGTQAGGSGAGRGLNIVISTANSSNPIFQFLYGGSSILDFNNTFSNQWTFHRVVNAASWIASSTTGTFPGFFAQLNSDANSRFNAFLDSSDRPIITMASGPSSGDVGLARVSANVMEVNNGTFGTGPGVILPRPTTFASLPASPTQGMIASITDGLAANCGDGSCTTFGTNVTGGTGALKLNLWYNGTHWTLIGK